MNGPDFDQLVGDDVSGDDRARLRRAHDALLAAGPPAELTPALRHAPGTPEHRAAVRVLPRGYPPRRLAAAAVIAAAAALASFGVGFLVGNDGGQETFRVDYTVPMTGTHAAPRAIASLSVGERDDDGNWPMLMRVRGLPAAKGDQRYELMLTRRGRPVALCGYFVVRDDETVVYLNAPYSFKGPHGWIVRRAKDHEVLLRTSRV